MQLLAEPTTTGLQEQIRRLAYQFYGRRGKGSGHELDDWLQAETQLTHRIACMKAIRDIGSRLRRSARSI
jgi:hypothetical protein